MKKAIVLGAAMLLAPRKPVTLFPLVKTTSPDPGRTGMAMMAKASLILPFPMPMGCGL